MKIDWQFADEKVSREQVEGVAREIGVSFSLDYIECAVINHGANVEPEAFNIRNREKVFGSLLSFDESSPDYFLKVYENYIANRSNSLCI